MKILETERLVLRDIELQDAPFLLELMNDPAYHQNIGDRGVRTLEDATRYIQEKFFERTQQSGFAPYVVEVKSSKIPAGICGFIKRDSLPDVDIGFAFLKRFQKQGYAYESAIAVLSHAEHVLKIKRIVAITRPENTASIKLIERIGMRFEKMILLPEIGIEDKLFSLDF